METQRPRGEGEGKTEVETRVMQPPGDLGTVGAQEVGGMLLEAQRERGHAHTSLSDFWPPEL